MRPLAGTDLLLEGELGRGASGTVFAARERTTGRRLAVKLLGRVDRSGRAERSEAGGRPPRRGRDGLPGAGPELPEHLERFRREGEVVAGLDHPGIVRIHSAGECETGPYLVYELVEGARPLDEVLAELPLARRVELVRDAAHALGHAHARGVVHRDVKPGNLLVDSSGRVRVTDFGVAAVRGASRLTRTGALVGTPTHMAPEQLHARGGLGPWTDVWGLGVVLYQGLAGELPFEAGSIHALMGAIGGSEPAPLRGRVPDLPPGLEAICLCALRKRPAERYPDAEALARDLDRLLAGEPPALAGPPGGRRGGVPLLLGGAGLGAAAALALFFSFAPGEAPAAPSAPAVLARAVAIGSALETPAASPGARGLAPELAALLPSPWPPAEGPGSELEHARASGEEARARLDQLASATLDAALAGNGEAMAQLAHLYDKGNRVPRSLVRSLHWLYRAVAADHPAGLNQLGERLLLGDGVPRDFERALLAHRRAAAAGDASGCFRVGWALANGAGAARDRDGAIEALERALRLGGPAEPWAAEARSNLALLLEERRGPGELERGARLAAELRTAAAADEDELLPLVEYLARSREGDRVAARAEARRLLERFLVERPNRAAVPRVASLRSALEE